MAFSSLSTTVARGARRRMSAIAAVVSACAALGPAAGTASADVTSIVTDTCSGALSTPFKPWLDFSSYTLVPGGDFERSLTGWSLNGGASLISGSEPWAVTGSLGRSSLSLPAGATAATAPVCVDLTRQTFRFFARNASVSVTATLKVDILYATASGAWRTIVAGAMTTAGIGGWQVSPIYVNTSSLALLSGLSHPSIRYRFTAVGGRWQVDDLFIDPYSRG
jgi:hypothetical protein